MAEKKVEKAFGVITVARRFSEPEPKPEGRLKRAVGKLRGPSKEEKETLEFVRRLKEVMDEIHP